MALLAGLIVWRAYASAMRPRRPVGDRIVGAICVYLLIGLAWAKVYETLDAVAPGSFRFPTDAAWAAPGLPRYTYVSFVTLATVGYGDVTPTTALAGTLAWLEAVTGQLYLAITISRLVALSLTEGRSPDSPRARVTLPPPASSLPGSPSSGGLANPSPRAGRLVRRAPGRGQGLAA